MNEQQPDLDKWDDFAGDWLKAEMIKKFPATLICMRVEAYFDEAEKAHLILTFNFNSKKKKFEVNKTNQDVIKKLGILSPKLLEHKKITFGSVKVRNPQTKAMVDSLLINSID